jgi:phosphoribosyl-ATP pyrophosphohydrolase/phosphoribosyl-AMP cyclohydrolase/histidinol dehydrogenase
MSEPLLRRLSPNDLLSRRRGGLDATTLAAAAAIVDDVRAHGEPALLAHALRLGDLKAGEPLVLPRKALDAAARGLPREDRDLLKRVAKRIRTFAEAQLAALDEVALEVPGGAAGHTLEPMESAGCYAPGGRFPLPSSVLMTVVPARVAGVERVWVASPRPTSVTLAAASLAGADGLLAVGGAHAIAALAYGAGPVPACDVVVGPGNRFVTAAKQLIAGHVAIDMLAGPSELVVVADAEADPELVAADLLAQAEHDPDALPVLVTTAGEAFASRVEAALLRQLATLPTAALATQALANGFVVLADGADAVVATCDTLAPEHLHLCTADADELAVRVKHYGALFVGPLSAEVLGDYGAGPNHVLPTGGTARSLGGLSVGTFLRTRTWLRLDDPVEARQLVDDAVRLARLEGLEAHARAAERRRL